MIPAMKCPIKAANQLSRDAKQATTLKGHSLQTHRDGPAPEWAQDPREQGGPVQPGRVTQGIGPAGLPGLPPAWTILRPSSPLCCLFTFVRGLQGSCPHSTVHCLSTLSGRLQNDPKESVMQQVGGTQLQGGQFRNHLPPESTKPHYPSRTGQGRLPLHHF